MAKTHLVKFLCWAASNTKWSEWLATCATAVGGQAGPEMYLLGAQRGWDVEEQLVVRTKGPLASSFPAVRGTLRQIDPAMPVDEFTPLGQNYRSGRFA